MRFFPSVAGNEFFLEGGKGAVRHGVVVGVADRSHRGDDADPFVNSKPA